MAFLETAVPFTLAFWQFFHLSSKLAFGLRQAFNGPSPVFLVASRWHNNQKMYHTEMFLCYWD